MSELITMRPTQIGLVQLLESASSHCSGKLTIVEVGSYQGESMEIFAKSGIVKTIVSIDPWKSGYDDKDIASKSDMVEVEKAFDSRAASVKEYAEVVKHKGTLDTFIQSDEFSKLKGKIDLVYIDACHTYEGCKHDIEICKQHLKPNIAFAGHDYADGWLGVKKAVNELLGKPDEVFGDFSWIKFVEDKTT